MVGPARYWRLADDDRPRRRSIADAVDVLATVPAFAANATATICTTPLFDQSGRAVCLVDIQFHADTDLVFVVSLPTAAGFRATSTFSSRRSLLDIQMLEGARVDRNSRVTLRDGRTLHAVELVPARLPYNPTSLEWRIIFGLVRMQNAQARCIPSWQDRASPEIREMIPAQLHMPDCQAIAQLEAPPLNELAQYLARHDWTLKKLSRQKIADTLEAFGVRPVKPRPQRGRSASIMS